MAFLSIYAMNNPLFKQIVGTASHSAIPAQLIDKAPDLDENGLEIQEFSYLWENTNRALGKNSIGVKTGLTPAAGPCLINWYLYKSS